MFQESKRRTNSVKVESGYVYLKHLRFKAYHGVLPQERVVGNDYVVELRIGYPLEIAVKSDRVEDTLNYAEVFSLVREEMKKPSALLEHVAGRIADALQQAFPKITSIDLKLTKVNPPMGADSDGAGVEISFKREA